MGNLSVIERKKIAYLSSYPPRECGIATFTKDLVESIDRTRKLKLSTIIAMNEQEGIYNYDRRVTFQIRQNTLGDYKKAACYVNSSKTDLVNLQHEFGLFGGKWGEYINSFIDNLQKLIVTTLHTIEPNFSPKAQKILTNIVNRSDAIVVITDSALKMLKNYDVPSNKIIVIPHGCPDIPLVPSEKVKGSLGLKGKKVLLTFGMINRGKGIQFAIRALPYAIKEEPDLLYLIIGETHPQVRKIEGERYRKKLIRLVEELGLEDHVRFQNRFLTKSQIIRYLQATDIFIAPYIGRNQTSSGTLTYALGAGKAIISTPYFHAKDLLADGRGLLCKFKSPISIANCIKTLFKNDSLRHEMEIKAYNYSREFIWPKVAEKYIKLFQKNI